MKVLVVVVLVFLALASAAKLRKAAEPIPGSYIIKMKDGHDVVSIAAGLGHPKILQEYKTVFNGFSAALTDDMLQAALESDAVEYIEEDGVVRTDEVASWGLDRVDQMTHEGDGVFEPMGNKGEGVNIYVVDTGIYISHMDFDGRASVGIDVRPSGDGIDCNGHGTHCAGTAAGTTFGVAKMANLFAVRVLNCNGFGSISDMAAGVDWVAANRILPAVITMSLGSGVSDIIDTSIRGVVNAGVSVSVSGGNDDFSSCQKSPARNPEAITVGATDSSDVRASFSNYGCCVDIFAPGVDITSAWYGSDDATNTISGTSMSTPHVAGAAALILGDETTLTPAEVKGRIQTKAIAGVVVDAKGGSPNLMLYVGTSGSGGGYIPEPCYFYESCGGYFSGTSGSFASQHYPEHYDISTTCDYIVSNPLKNHSVTVVIDEFELEANSLCTWDSLSIYDGSDSSAPLIGEYCGLNNPGIITSTGDTMFLRMKSDSSVTKQGFHAKYTSGGERGGCGHTFTSDGGFIFSPNYPHEYGDNHDCTFIIEGAVDKMVTITFDDFEVEQHTGCDFDSLKIYDGDSDQGTPLVILCGLDIPEPVSSTLGSGLFLKFKSDSSVSRKGFSAMFQLE
ncbi:extracellular serine proteinase-like [Lytechinus pictus]|uniref:extracellular serine proteinase-like n=1 Tax=Lytechinus pictus TaxID=7653 RepID=UPI0030B9B787